MHSDEFDIDLDLVKRLIADQLPQWDDLDILPVRSAGTVNALFRLGDEMVVRLPRIASAEGGADKEQRWLPKLAPHLPLAIPLPLAEGRPTEEFPMRWSVLQWVEGETWRPERVTDLSVAASKLAQFISALRRIDPTGGPDPSPTERGTPLRERDEVVREAIAELGEKVDASTVTAAWEMARDAPAWEGPPAWFHGDLLPGNLLVQGGRLSAVIDFEAAGVGDPSCDLMPAWMLFSGPSRAVFREELGVDDDEWERGRGWALSVALLALPYYWETNPPFVELARYTIAETLADLV